jgi:hypothetical protein
MSDEGRARRKEPWDMTGPELIEALATDVFSGAMMRAAQAREVQALLTAWQDAAASDHAHAQRQAERAEQAEARVAKLEAEAQEHEASFALYDDACRRGTALWRAGDPEHRRMVLPDTAALVAWLLERLTALEAALDEQAVATYGPAEVAHKVAEAVKQAEARAAQAEHRLRTLWRERDEVRDMGEGWAGEPHGCQCEGPDDSCPACSAIEPPPLTDEQVTAARQLLDRLIGYDHTEQFESIEDYTIDVQTVADALNAVRADELAYWTGHVERWLGILPGYRDASEYERGCAQTLANLRADMDGTRRLRSGA